MLRPMLGKLPELKPQGLRVERKLLGFSRLQLPSGTIFERLECPAYNYDYSIGPEVPNKTNPMAPPAKPPQLECELSCWMQPPPLGSRVPAKVGVCGPGLGERAVVTSGTIDLLLDMHSTGTWEVDFEHLLPKLRPDAKVMSCR